MKSKIAILSLLSFGIISCVTSCSSCTPDVNHASNLTCDAGNCSDTTASTINADGATSTVIDAVNDEKVCRDQSNIPQVCQEPPSVEEVTTQLVKGDTWQITLPLNMQKKVALKQDIVLSVFSEKDKMLVVLLKESFKGTFDEYALTALRSIKETGAKVESSKAVEINGTKFTLVEALKNDVKIWSLVSTKDGFGYGLSCGGPAPYDSLHAACTAITDTFKLN